MSLRGLGLLLVWMGAFALMTVLMYRIRKGAWSADALETPRPVAPWTRGAAIAGMILAVSGIVLMVWSFAFGVD